VTFCVEVPWSFVRPTFRHAEEFWRLRCAPDLLLSGLFPNMKEITESMAAVAAAHRWAPKLGLSLGDPGVSLVVVGDGSTPRTAALAAYRSAWTCHSIDPNLSRASLKPSREAAIRAVRRLHVHPYKAQEMPDPIRAEILLAVHSHAKIPDALLALDRLPTLIVAIPCCVAQVRPDGYRVLDERHDKGIWSPQNKVCCWARDASIFA
jgi:hypothetical protein